MRRGIRFLSNSFTACFTITRSIVRLLTKELIGGSLVLEVNSVGVCHRKGNRGCVNYHSYNYLFATLLQTIKYKFTKINMVNPAKLIKKDIRALLRKAFHEFNKIHWVGALNVRKFKELMK
ncbi:hypothetical protein BpHYR1_047091, partial [Brachionus plicatilis]